MHRRRLAVAALLLVAGQAIAEEAAGELALEGDAVENLQEARARLTFQPTRSDGHRAPQPLVLRRPLAEFPVSVPAGAYAMVAVELTDAKEAVFLTAYRSQLNVSPGEAVNIQLNRPDLKLSVNQKAGKLTANLRTVTPEGLTYTNLGGPSGTKQPPTIEFYAAETPGRPFHAGTMAYG